MREETIEAVETTIREVSAKIQETVLAGNAAGAAQWSEALRNACEGRELLHTLEEE